jgi:hypothetical protein
MTVRGQSAATVAACLHMQATADLGLETCGIGTDARGREAYKIAALDAFNRIAGAGRNPDRWVAARVDAHAGRWSVAPDADGEIQPRPRQQCRRTLSGHAAPPHHRSGLRSVIRQSDAPASTRFFGHRAGRRPVPRRETGFHLAARHDAPEAGDENVLPAGTRQL